MAGDSVSEVRKYLLFKLVSEPDLQGTREFKLHVSLHPLQVLLKHLRVKLGF